MKAFQLPLFAVLLQAYLAAAKVPALEVGDDAKISEDGKKIKYTDPNCEPSSSWTCDASRSCTGKKVWSLDASKDHAACCLPSQHLSGSADTEFFCCAKDHEVAGSADAGYSCCPTGSSYDGEKCKPVCKNGKQLKNGKCVCPKGTVEQDDGTCKKKKKDEDPDKCTSGLETGKCYTFRASNGHLLGRHSDNRYYAAPDSIEQRFGKFQLCKDEDCKAGLPINPSDALYIKDIHGQIKTGHNHGQWLDEQVNGNHISVTPDFEKAGEFSISKWPCGKYCLGGFEHGLGPACPSNTPAITFYSEDPQMCVPYELTEVPCDIKDDKNNCIWTNGADQCCDKMHCPA
ncbi:cystein rich protein [Aspergillus terreus]|uniref:Cystein rich protein n=1 Tax=Aspergillus terreus TaxID=33178 RepID=A0A5M3YWH9_ASPTE|nr:hypothetical protein ATETN484_0003064800 [Aspergillus terreus]GFF14637.1 cystein rich protein [Aspergillus terreus]